MNDLLHDMTLGAARELCRKRIARYGDTQEACGGCALRDLGCTDPPGEWNFRTVREWEPLYRCPACGSLSPTPANTCTCGVLMRGVRREGGNGHA